MDCIEDVPPLQYCVFSSNGAATAWLLTVAVFLTCTPFTKAVGSDIHATQVDDAACSII
jgi:hypothetical protein